MKPAHPDQPFITHLLELMSGMGPVIARRMFGGHGLFMHDLMFALVSEQVLYFKVDKKTQEAFTARGLQPFVYYKKGKPFNLSYYQAPDEALEAPDEMHAWAEVAYGVALRANNIK